MRIDIGTPEPWVDVEPFGPSREIAAGFYVKCSHCGGTSSAYMPYLVKHPETIERFVAQHNRCLPRAA